jgi:predicted ArsR family transcriptional regulator
VTVAQAQGVGRVLARLTALAPGRPGRADSLAGQSREALLELLRASGQELTIEQLSAATGLHANTVRGHLEVLLAAGEVKRSQGQVQGRGRPPWRYAASGPNAELVAELDGLLSGLLASDESEAFVRDAAHRWAEALDPAARDRPASDPQDALDRAVTALGGVGFEAELSPIGDTITLTGCPYAALVRDHPVICRIHTALLQDLFDRSGQPVSVAEMQVWPTPGACLVKLNRPDHAPVMIIGLEQLSRTMAAAAEPLAGGAEADPGTRGKKD